MPSMLFAHEPTPPALAIRILIVDDRVENILALEAAFAKSGYELVSALSGQEALAILREKDFAAILLDVQMPGLDGFETAHLVRHQERSKNTPIIFVTAINRGEDYERKGYISGAVDFLFKPLDTDILLAKVAVFAELYESKLEIKRQAELLKEQALKEQELVFMRRALETRDEFLSVASHELNTPLTPLGLQLQSFLKILREGRFHEIDSVRLERMLTTASGQVDRLSRIVKELVDVSRISKSKFELVRGIMSLADVVNSVLEAFAEEIHRLGCDVRLEVHSNPVGNWDRTRLEQVVINLLTNALKYGLGRPILITIDGNEESAILSVKDRGIGIAKEDQDRVFERFERAVSSKNYGGLGLGLFITKAIVQQHQGTLQLDSTPNAGSTFVVTLPTGKAAIS